MLRTLRIKNLALVTDLTLELRPGYNVITGETGASAWLERGTNFASWSAITNFVNAIGTFEFIDSDVTNLSQGIYRVRQ